MGFEYELKYRAVPALQAKLHQGIPGPWQRIAMETTYYDTPSRALSQRRFTLRRRLENGVSVCTVKTPAGDLGRGEWELLADSIEMAIPELCKLGAPDELIRLTAEGVEPICGARFTRLACTVATADGTVELALDRGILFAGGREQNLCEVEVELKSGSREAAQVYARQLAEQYGLSPENKSKFRRALDLCKEETP